MKELTHEEKKGKEGSKKGENFLSFKFLSFLSFEWWFNALSASKAILQGENIQLYNLFSPVMMIT